MPAMAPPSSGGVVPFVAGAFPVVLGTDTAAVSHALPMIASVTTGVGHQVGPVTQRFSLVEPSRRAAAQEPRRTLWHGMRRAPSFRIPWHPVPGLK